MASRRFDVGQGAIAWLFAGSLLLSNACSGDSDVDFTAAPDANGGDASNGGSQLTSSGTDTGATASGGASTNGGKSNSGGGSTAGGATGGKASAGSGNGGSNTAAGTGGSGSAGKGNAGSSAGGVAGTSNNAGAAGSTSGNGGLAGTGGTSNGGDAGSAGSGGANSDCVAATFGGHSYYFCGVVDSAAAAVTKCQSLNMTPITIESMAENTFVMGKQKGQSWLGGTDALKEGEWRWAPSTTVFWDGAPKSALPQIPDGSVDGVYNNFVVGQPNNNNVDGFPENCLATSASGWNDLYCNLTGVRAACEGTGPVILPNL